MSDQKIQIHLPFSGAYPISFPFAAAPSSQAIIDKYSSLGLVGHNGIDYEMPQETEIVACDSGVVSSTGTDVNFGIYITIKHIWGKSIYAHLKSTIVKKSDKVIVGQAIGLSGQTGFVTGPHLHFGIKPHNPNVQNGYLGFIDPAPYFV